MSREMETVARKRGLMLGAIGLFVLTATLAVVINTLAGYGFHLEYSISRYVGLETWSAVLFALGNFLVAAWIAQYLDYLGRIWEMPRWFFWVIVVMVAALVGLSVCPLGYFDRAPGVKSMPTLVHELASRLMFSMMMVVAAAMLVKGKIGTAGGVAFLVYGVLCVLGYLLKAPWFMNMMLIFESGYLLGFMVLCWGAGDNKRLEKEDGRAEN